MRTYWHDRWLGQNVLRWVPHWVTPNQLTVIRLVLTPLLIWIIYREHIVLGVIFFLFLAFTDVLDGSLARMRKCVTEWGMIMDPVADKILIGSMGAVLLLQHFPVVLAIVILSVEVVFLLGGYFYKRHGAIISANVWGKIKMVLQVVGLTMYLISLAVGGSEYWAYASYSTLSLAVVFAFISLFSHGI